MSLPLTLIVPSALTNPVIASMHVVLPAPFGPISPTSAPAPTSNDTSDTARTAPNRTDSESTRSTDIRHRPHSSSSRAA